MVRKGGPLVCAFRTAGVLRFYVQKVFVFLTLFQDFGQNASEHSQNRFYQSYWAANYTASSVSHTGLQNDLPKLTKFVKILNSMKLWR